MSDLTFDAEGQEGGRFHSRKFHVPSSASGLTIGRGYDMKLRLESVVYEDLISSGLDPRTAVLISRAAGLKGRKAETFIEENDLQDFEVSTAEQRKLFDIEYRRKLADTQRLATKADVTRAYGETNWDALHPIIKDVLVDLRFRGDYTPWCRKFLQVHVAHNDLAGFSKEIADESRWPKVPSDRRKRRKAYCENAMA